MKNSGRTFSKIHRHSKSFRHIAFFICIVFVFSFTLTFSFLDFQDGNNNNKTASATIDPSVYKQDLHDSFDALAHGSTFIFTDKSKVDDFRAGSIASDTTEVTVDRTHPHGSLMNPYVINSINGNSNGRGSWNAFVSAMADTANNYGKDKYFVITRDLDWQSGTISFNQVGRFDGNLFGLGHSLKNIRKDFGHNSSLNAGVFTSTNGVIADLSVANYAWVSVVRGGGMAANSTGSFFNCHLQGTITSTVATGNAMDVGGLVNTSNTGFYAYRCSADWSASMTANTGNGSACGCLIANSNGGMTVYDCYVNTILNLRNPSSDMYTGCVMGIPYLTTSNNQLNIENIYATINVGELNNLHGDSVASVLTGYHSSVGSGNRISFSNIYVDGKVTRNGVVMTMPLSSHISGQPYTNISVSNSNINYVNGYSSFVNSNNKVLNAKVPTTNPPTTAHSNASALANAAQSDSNFKVWDKTKIGATYSVANNPVRNISIEISDFTAKFYNLKNGNKESLGVSDIKNYTTSTTFPTPVAPSSNHKFVGWTMNLDDDKNIYDKDSTFTSDIYGDVEFYAVWDVDAMTDDSFSASASTVEYLTGKITLTATISATNMTPSTVTYSWKKDGSAIGDTSGTKTIENVKESGKYELDYCIRSDAEPLWRHYGTHSQTVTITPGKLTPQSLSVDKTAYFGMELNNLTPTAVMHNSKGESISGTTHWALSLGKVSDNPTDPNYVQGKAYAEFYFIPDSSYNGNYVSGNTASGGENYNKSTSSNIVYFNAEYIKVIFNMMTQLGENLSFDVNIYNDTLSYSRIAKGFDKLWADYYAANSSVLDSIGISGYTPQFKHADGRFYNISDYRTKTGGYENVMESITIDVNFVAATYSVTYKFDDEAGTSDRVENGKTYGQQILKPSNPANGALMFLGWYYPATDINGDPIYETNGEPKLNKWDFDLDRIFGDLVLTARWLKAEKLDRIEVVANKPSYTALDSIVAGDLTVTAIFIAKDENGDPIEMPVVLEFSEYKDGIAYVGNIKGDNTLHVSSDGSLTQIKVSYSYFNDGTDYSDTETVWLTVNPRKIDVSDLDIKDKYVIYDGNAHGLDQIDLNKVQHLTDPNSRKITGISYTYYYNRNIIEPENIIELGDYSVVISFTTNDPDFKVEEINTMLYIVSELPPGVDPGNPGGEEPTNPGENIGEKIKNFFEKLIESHFPLWQVVTSAVCILLTLIFMIKAIQYGNRKKKAKSEAKKYKAKAYATLLPIFSTEIVWLNLPNKIWSIIAFSLVGVTVLMFLIALITRRGWKKAELAKESVIEDRELRKEEAEQQERKELKEQLALMSGGQFGQGADSNAIIEEMRREMAEREERYRRDEEERRREDEERHRQEMDAMKMMLANMMGRAQTDGDIPYASMDDTDLLVQKVIAGLLPAVQQMMPEATAYLTAPSEENEELKALVEEQRALVEEQRAIVDEQNEEIRSMSAQVADLQEQLIAMSQDRVEGVLLPDQSEDIVALTNQIAELQEQLLNASQDGENDNSEEIKALTAEMSELRNQLNNITKGRVEVIDNSETIRSITEEHTAELKALSEGHSEEIKALTSEMQKQFAKIDDLQQQIASMSQGNTTVYVEREAEDDDNDDEEEWDSILDEEEDDFLEAVIIEEDGSVKKTSPNFRMRLKQSSDKNREWYTAIKNLFCSQKGITYRVYKRVEKIRYQGQVIAVIGIAKRSIKLWLALKPYEYDARRYHHKDVSDKPRFVDVPMYVRVGSDRALTRAQELILALFQELNMEARKRYNDRDIQELIFTLKHNRLLTNKQNKQLLCEVMHVHDCDVLDDETAEKCIEFKNVDFIEESVIETVKLDDIDAKFQDGNRVTLDKLKKVGLVSEECTGYNVVADKRLTKPLIIVANDFTLTAVKLIALTGGRAIKLNKV